MSRRRLEKQIGAYRDGDLSERQAEALRRKLEADPEARLELARHEALGRLTREAWRAGPPPPSPEMLIAVLRPALTRIDRELEKTRPERWRGWLAPAPLVAIGTAAALLALAIVQPAAIRPTAERAAAALAARADTPTPQLAVESTAASTEPERDIPVYDLAQGDSPLMLFENDGTTFIWLIEPEKLGDDLSALPGGWA
jgi:anti-sigma factor RsiW